MRTLTPLSKSTPTSDKLLLFKTELFKTTSPEMFCTFNGILTSFWDEEIMPQEFKDATIISIFKNKADYKAGNKADCGNYRDI